MSLQLVQSLVIVALSILNTCRAENPQVTTSLGVMEGVEEDGAYSFRGIRYAVPPLRRLRWKPPVHMTDSWEDVYNAHDFGEQCFQPNAFDLDEHVGSEDCLFLNVWTPNLDPSVKLPVMVWIHGGYNVYLNGNYPDYSPTGKLSYETDIVYVSMNYRLNLFGFMALELISEASPTHTSGNYGLMDQIEALKWVQKEILHFGGDPSKVTVFGQSSGGTDIYALLASRMARDLFHKAWISSSSPVLTKTTAEASQDNLLFLRNTRCRTLACLKRLPAANLTRAIPWVTPPNWAMEEQTTLPQKGEMIGALPVVDGYVLTDEPRKAWLNYKNDVPLLCGRLFIICGGVVDLRTPSISLDIAELPCVVWFCGLFYENSCHTKPKSMNTICVECLTDI